MAAYNEILLWFSDIFNVNIVSSRQLFYKSNCSLIFFPVILSHNFQNRNSMKTRDICTKICILCPGFLAYQDIYEKNVYYIPCVCHNRTFLPSSRPYVPFDFYKRTFLSSFCLYVLCRCHSRTFLPPFRPYIPSSDYYMLRIPVICPTSKSANICFIETTSLSMRLTAKFKWDNYTHNEKGLPFLEVLTFYLY